MKTAESEHWDLIIESKSKWYSLRLGEILRYRDLLFLFVRRDFVSIYKQTILGPIWFFIQPALTALTFAVIFGNLAKISTDGIPQMLFYLAGVTIWTYFAETLTKTADTFSANAAIFGKVYFPRMVVPLSIVVSNLVKMGVQFLLFMVVWLYYFITTDLIRPNAALLLFPFLALMMGFLGLGFGIIITSLTTKYRDLKFLIVFAVQLMMYVTPIVYPLSMVTGKARIWLLLNPVTSIVETVKYGFLGSGYFSPVWLGYSLVFTIILFLFGLLIFNRVEKSFTDTV